MLDATYKGRNFTFRTTEYLFKKLSYYAHIYGMKKSEFIRRVLEKAVMELDRVNK